MRGKRAKSLRAAARQGQESVRPNRTRKILFFAAPVVLLVALVAAGHFGFFHSSPANPAPQHIYPLLTYAQKVRSLDDLLKMPTESLKDVDIAEMNLLCATGLRGAENLDVGKALARLNDWAERVRYWTDRSLWDFRRNPEKFENSEAKFRVLLLISVIQQDFGVHYNERGERNCDFSNAKNAFLHGMIDDTNGGTCASMAVMYVAVGRRLGYPMRLMLAKTHIFARWENPATGERFNIEGTNAQFADHPDSYYRNWPDKITDEEMKQGWYLKPLTPAEELAVFLHNRGYCLMDSGHFAEAKAAFSQAAELAPQDPLGRMRIASAAEAMRPIPVGTFIRWVPGKGYVDEDGVPFAYPDPMANVERINAINRTNRERAMQPPQPYQPPTPGGVQPYRPPQPGVPQPTNPYGPANPYGPQLPYQPGRP